MIQKLGQICDFHSGNAWKASKFKDEGIPIIRINNMKPNATDFKYWDWEEPYDSKYFVEEGDILVSLSGTIKTYKWVGVKALLNQRIVKVTAKENINIDWVYYQLSNVIERISDKGKDAVIKNVSVTALKKYEVDVPDLPTQNKIVALLDKASALVQKREKSIALLDELLRAQFLEMFGDPVLNPNGWDMIKLKDLGDWKSGGTPSKAKKEYFEGTIPWLSSGELNDIYIEDTKEHITEEAIKNSNTKRIEIGSLLLGMYDTAALKSSVNTKVLCCNQAISYAKLDSKKAITEFVYFNIQYNKDYLKSKQRGVRQQNLNLTMVKNIEIFDVPLPKQDKFKKLLDEILNQKETLIQSKRELEHLYNSLLQRAFSGQLNFNIDIELDALLAAIDIEQDTEKEKHDIKEIATVYAGRLLERIEEQKFDNQTQYQQAKQVVFQMLEEGIVEQAYDENVRAVKLKLV